MNQHLANYKELNHFKTTLDMTLDGVFMVDAETFQFFYVNQGAVKLLGYTQNELLQMSFWDIAPEYPQEIFQALVAPLIEGSQPTLMIETVNQHKDGTSISVEIFLQYIQVAEYKNRFVAFVHDITQRSIADAQLLAAYGELNHFKTTLDMMLDSVFMALAKTLQLFYVNQGMVKLLGYTQEELSQMTLLDIIPEYTSENIQALINPLMAGSQPALKFEAITQHKNGTNIPVEIFLQYVQIKAQKTRFVAIMRNITERKQAETTLREALDVAEVANRAKTAFLAHMSHELRTPLNAILGYTQLFLHWDETLDTEQRENIEVIQRSGEYLLTLINDVLDLSKIEAERLALIPKDFYFDVFIKSINDLFQVRAEKKGITFDYQPLTQLPTVIHADETRLRQILINLLSNAIKFTKQGNVTFQVGHHYDKIRFQITDTGIGIAQEELDKIFLPFQQVGERDYQNQGTGLGLAITKKLVNMMGGNLHVESILGQGTTFWVEMDLPKAFDVIPEPTNEPKIIGIEFQSPKILVAEDQDENRAVLVGFLAPLGFEVVEACDGQETVNKARQIQPDLILMDLVMPIMDGIEATRQIRQISELKNVVIIAISTSAFEFHFKQSREVGCNDFIAKPFNAQLLLAKLQKYLNIKWIYDKIAQNQMDLTVDAKQPIDIPEKGPSPKQAALLHSFALMGDISSIIDFVRQLEESDSTLQPFTNNIRHLAKNLQVRQIRKIAQSYMETTGE